MITSAEIESDSVRASAIPARRAHQAFVDVDFTRSACPPTSTLAGKEINSMGTGSTVPARIAGAFINIWFDSKIFAYINCILFAWFVLLVVTVAFIVIFLECSDPPPPRGGGGGGYSPQILVGICRGKVKQKWAKAPERAPGRAWKWGSPERDWAVLSLKMRGFGTSLSRFEAWKC